MATICAEQLKTISTAFMSYSIKVTINEPKYLAFSLIYYAQLNGNSKNR